MNYYGINYCRRKVFHNWKDWAWWQCSNVATYFPDIKQRFFIRVFGIEFKIMRWAPQGERADGFWVGAEEFSREGFDRLAFVGGQPVVISRAKPRLAQNHP